MAKKKPPQEAKNNPESEIMPPEAGGDETNVYAIIQHFSSNPEKMLEVLEQHDPGFIKHFNKKSEAFADKSRESRFRFGEIQAYTSLLLRVIAVVGASLALFYAIYSKAGLGTYLGIVLFMAVANGGLPVWRQIGKAIAERIRK